MRKLLILFVAMLFVACGNGADEAQDLADPTPTSNSDKPVIKIPDGDPPKKLVIEDIKKGDGPKVKEGASVVAHYVGVSWSTGEEFDSSWDRGQPTPFSLLQVIPGWQEGIPGMREGGRRKLTIPPDLAYADSPPPDSGIKSGETLVFVVDMVDADAA